MSCRRLFALGLLLPLPVAALAGVAVMSDHTTACYDCGEQAVLQLDYTPEGDSLAGEFAMRIESGEGLPLAQTNVVFGRESLRLRLPVTLARPGLAVCRVALPGAAETAACAVAFGSGQIRPATARPADFETFWRGEVARLGREVPLVPDLAERTVSPLPGRRTYDVSFRTFGNETVAAVLSVPRDETKAPFPVRVVTAGCEPDDRADEIVLALALPRHGAITRKLLLGFSRAVDWVAAHPLADSGDVTFMGEEIGYGLLGVSRRFRRGAVLSTFAPPAGDPYLDPAHFAPSVRVPVLAGVGLLDPRAADAFAAYNALSSGEKDLMSSPGLGRSLAPRFRRAAADWVREAEGKRTREIRAVLLQFGHNMWCDWFPEDFDLSKVGQGLPDTRLLLKEEHWRRVTDRLAAKGMNMLVVDLGEGVVFPSHPELAIPGSWPTEKFRQELARLRGLGIEVIPKLNFSTSHDGWLKEYGHMVSSPTYYRVVADLIADVAKLFDRPRFMHIGMDEETAKHQAVISGYQLVTVRQPALWEHDFLFLVRQCENNGMRAWAWADHLWAHADFIERCPKSVVFSNWFYDERNRGFSVEGNHTPDREIVRTYHRLRDFGFDQIPCGSNYTGWVRKAEGCTGDDVIGRTVRFARTEIPGDRLLGYMMAPWMPFETAEQAEWNLRGIELFADALEGRVPPCQRAGVRLDGKR
ncbi:MAG: acetylxylan esterase [Kiritimatiellia bacterium]